MLVYQKEQTSPKNYRNKKISVDMYFIVTTHQGTMVEVESFTRSFI